VIQIELGRVISVFGEFGERSFVSLGAKQVVRAATIAMCQPWMHVLPVMIDALHKLGIELGMW